MKTVKYHDTVASKDSYRVRIDIVCQDISATELQALS